MFLAGLVVVILMIAVSVNAMSLNKRLGENRKRTVQLKKEIQTEEQRAADIEEHRRYTSTDA
jgi:Flp pilus assembly protein TadB